MKEPLLVIKKKKRELATHLKLKKKDPKKINILRTSINRYRIKLVNHQIANKQNLSTLYQYPSRIPFIWELDFLLCNECSSVRKVISNYKEKNKLLRSLYDQAPGPDRDLKKIKIFPKCKSSKKGSK